MRKQMVDSDGSDRTNPTIGQSDHETRLIEEDHHSIKLWLRLLTCSNLIEGQLRTAMREECNTTLPRFDFLAQLERSPNGLTMSELSKRTMVSGGNVSGIARQLERDGLISRVSLLTDRRSFVVNLTALGRTEFTAMAASHEQWIIAMFSQLEAREVAELKRLLGKVKSTVAVRLAGL